MKMMVRRCAEYMVFATQRVLTWLSYVETRTVITGQGVVLEMVVAPGANIKTMAKYLVKKHAEHAKNSGIAKVLAVQGAR